jgi:hypothetical protein
MGYRMEFGLFGLFPLDLPVKFTFNDSVSNATAEIHPISFGGCLNRGSI